MNLVCTLFPEPIGGFWLNLHTNTTENWEKKKKKKRFDFDGLDHTPTSTLNVKFWPKSLSAPYLLNQMMDSG